MSASSVHLITGLQGNGKTLYAIAHVKEWSERETRPVFYHGINILDEVALPWTKIDPERWFDAPPGAIVIIDECQILFRPRALTKEPPDYVSKLETLRHSGINLVLITQHPMLVDTAIRRLTGMHKHCIRKFGLQASTIHEWHSVKENCDKDIGRKDSIKHHWVFDKKIYPLYKSAEIHTVKSHIPRRIFVMLLLPVLIVFLIFYAVQYFRGLGHSDRAAKPSNSDSGFITSSASQTSGSKADYKNALADAREYVYERTPRIDGLAHTAPRYDEVTKPVTAPVPVACVSRSSGCTCYTQQATRMDVPQALCLAIVDRGFFVDFDDGSKHTAQIERPETSQAALNRSDATSTLPALQTHDTEPKIASATGYGLAGRRDGLRSSDGVRTP
jgi:zona occludens toxin